MPSLYLLSLRQIHISLSLHFYCQSPTWALPIGTYSVENPISFLYFQPFNTSSMCKALLS